MNKNIVIIVVAAVVAFLAVLAIPRLLDGGEDDAPVEVADAEDSASSSAAPQSEAEKDEPRPAPPAGRRSNPQLAQQIAEAARQVNANGPVVIDELTTMTAAQSRGNRIRYRYELSRELSPDQANSFRDFASRTNQQTICNRDETRRLIDMGGEIEYVYYGPGDTFLFSTPIVRC
jgi:hypothetical protein